MLDTILYIPAILAYVFVGLLISILSFIVIYISHKIYLSIYDTLPINSLINIPAALVKEEKESHRYKQLRHTKQSFRDAEGFAEKSTARRSNRGHSFDLKRDNPSFSRKAAKTAFRIIVSLEPSYLAFVVFETETVILRRISTLPQHTRLVQYYDRLSALPIGKVMQRCPIRSFSLSGTLRDIITVNLHK